MADNVRMRSDGRLAMQNALIVLGLIAGIAQIGRAQTATGDQSWSTSSQGAGPSGALNPTRTRTTHEEVNGRIVDKTVVEALGPDGRYVPYSEIERESVRVNDTTVRDIERSYGTTPDGQRSLTQETQEETRSSPDGERRVTRTTSNPDANGGLQVIQREVVDSKELSPGVRETKTTLFSADGSGGLGATIQIDERERRTDATTVEFTKSTRLSDGAGHWNLSEVREGATRQEVGGGTTKEERVLRPDGDGKLGVVERTVSRQSAAGQNTTDTYSTDVPGQAGSEGLKLVRRDSTVQQTGANRDRRTTRQVEQPNPGDPGAGLRVTQEAIDIVRPGANGTAAQTSTILTFDSNGRGNTVWVDMGKTDNPAVIKVDIGPAKK